MKGRRRKQPALGDLRHRVKLCAWLERPDADVSVIRERPPVAEVWASIKARRAWQEFGQNADGGDDQLATHEIVIRTPSDILITSQFWVFGRSEARDQWWKVLRTEPYDWDTGSFLKLICAAREFRDRRADPVAVQQVPGDEFEGYAMTAPLKPIAVFPKE